MRPSSDIPPQLRHPLNHAPGLPVHRLRWLPLLRTVLASALRTKPVPGVAIRDTTHHGAWLRIYTPPSPAPAALLWIHGGGLILGEARQDDGRCTRVAKKLGIHVVSVDYRVAPEHPFPAAIDDCFTAWRAITDERNPWGVDPTRVVIGGASAGGGLAAALAQRVLDEGGPQPAGQLLFYPMLDDRTAARRELDDQHFAIWNNRNNRGGWSAYLGQPAGSRSTPAYAVPARREELAGLAPAWIGTGTKDLFLPENRDYARRLADAGVACELFEVPGGVHGFEQLVPKADASKRFIQSQDAFLRERLAL